MLILRRISLRLLHFNRYFYTTKRRADVYRCVQYNERGDPNTVLKLDCRELLPLKEGEVRIKMLAAPVHPADMNMIQGIYPVKPPLPAVGGYEGVGEVVEIKGDTVTLSIGQRVLPMSKEPLGTWREFITTDSSSVMPVDNDIPMVDAATIAVNPCTAYRMLTEFVDLEPGDVIIQNGANSAVGQAVIQLARARDVTTVNIVRDRDDLQPLVDDLQQLGADHVVTDTFVRSPDFRSFLADLPKVKLCLNCVGGKAALDVIKHMPDDSVMVTYGGMSKMPVPLPAGPLIFRNLAMRGFWMTWWYRQHGRSERRLAMHRELCDLVRAGSLRPPRHRLLPLTQYREAVSRTLEGYNTQKQILVMQD